MAALARVVRNLRRIMAVLSVRNQTA